MESPTQKGGDDGARERAEVLEAEALLDAPTPTHEPAAEQPAPVSVEPTPEPTEADRRLAVLRERSTPARDAETGRFVPNEEPQQDDTGVEAEAEPVEAAPEDPPSPALPDGLRQGEDGQWYVDFKVDGESRSEPYATYHANAQKYLTGDRRLQEAAIARKRLEQEAQALRAPQSTQLPSDAGVNVPPQGGQQGITREQLEKAVVEGDEQAQAVLLERLNRETAPVDLSVIPEMTREAMRAELANQAAETAAAALSKDETHGKVNDWITTDPMLQQQANARIAELIDAGYSDPAERVRMAVEHVRSDLYERFPALVPQPPAPPPDSASLAQRTAAKAAQANVNSVVGGQATQTLAVPPPAPPSTGSVLEKMRIARQLR